MFQSAAAAPSPVMGNMPPNDALPGGPMPPGFFQVSPHPFTSSLLTSGCGVKGQQQQILTSFVVEAGSAAAFGTAAPRWAEGTVHAV